jgi:hypothetical protein
MTNKHQFSRMAGLALAACIVFTTITITMNAQTVISNESPAGFAFVANKTLATAKCDTPKCSATASMLKSIPVTCPAAIGQTCTFYISLVSKVSIGIHCKFCFGGGPAAGYQFLVDGLPPSVGPTDAQGGYLFARNAFTGGENTGSPSYLSRQSFAASVIATVTNTDSNNHSIDVNITCRDAFVLQPQGGCEAIAHDSTMRVDVFEP